MPDAIADTLDRDKCCCSICCYYFRIERVVSLARENRRQLGTPDFLHRCQNAEFVVPYNTSTQVSVASSPSMCSLRMYINPGLRLIRTIPLRFLN